MSEKIVLFGASAGGVEALSEICQSLPDDFQPPVCIVQHIPTITPTKIVDVLRRLTKIPVMHPADYQKIEPNHIYVAPTNKHLLIRNEQMRLDTSPKENLVRPSIDKLFRSAAHTYQQNTIGVILTGLLYDGAAGLREVKRHGGLVAVQDPVEALYDSMPRSAIEKAQVTNILSLHEIVPWLLTVTANRSAADTSFSDQIAGDGNNDLEGKVDETQTPSRFTCPECHGTLWEVGEERGYQCRVGHRFSAEVVLAQKTEEIEHAVWTILRALEEKLDLLERLARDTSEPILSESYRIQAAEARLKFDDIKLITDRAISP